MSRSIASCQLVRLCPARERGIIVECQAVIGSLEVHPSYRLVPMLTEGKRTALVCRFSGTVVIETTKRVRESHQLVDSLRFVIDVDDVGKVVGLAGQVGV